ncbi:MAG: replicase polyprotein (domains: peptidase, methyltransferase, helicase) [Plant associated closterovirus 1]|nr:MAG: replicase polyprotein (domains: peptidase, methyltransferase, helicase) [Plant associated closterovirus 1]
MLVSKFGTRALNYEIAGYRSSKDVFHVNNNVRSFWPINRLPKFVGQDESDEKAAIISDATKSAALEAVFKRSNGGRESLLTMAVEKDVIAYKDLLAQYQSDKEPVTVPFYMSQNIQDLVTRSYPQFKLNFTHSAYSDHPAAAASRLLENYTLSRLCGGNFSDIGGCPLFHMRQSKCNDVHVCRPLYDPKDVQRKVVRVHQLRNLAKNMDATEINEAASRIDVCSLTLGDCKRKSRSLIMVQVYDASLNQICNGMIASGADICYLTIVTPGEILDKREAFTVSSLGCEVTLDSHKDTITYRFGSSCYTHTLSTLVEIMSTSHYTLKDNFFSVEMYEVRMNVNYYKITRSAITPGFRGERILRYPRSCTNLVRVKMPKYDRKLKRCLPSCEYLYLDAAFVSRIFDYVVSNCSVVNSKTFEWVWSYIKSSKSRVVISGKIIHRDVELDINHREPFAATILAAGVRTRLASEHLAKTMNLYNGDASILQCCLFLVSEAYSSFVNSVSRSVKDAIKSCLSTCLGLDHLDLDGAFESISDYAEVVEKLNVSNEGVVVGGEENDDLTSVLKEALSLRVAADSLPTMRSGAKGAKDKQQAPQDKASKGGLRGGASHSQVFAFLSRGVSFCVNYAKQFVHSWCSSLSFVTSEFFSTLFCCAKDKARTMLTKMLSLFDKCGFPFSLNRLEIALRFFLTPHSSFEQARDAFFSFSTGLLNSFDIRESGLLKPVLKAALSGIGLVLLAAPKKAAQGAASYWDSYVGNLYDKLTFGDSWVMGCECLISSLAFVVYNVLTLGSFSTPLVIVREVGLAILVEHCLLSMSSDRVPASTFGEAFFRKSAARIASALYLFAPGSFLLQALVVSDIVPSILRHLLCSLLPSINDDVMMYTGYVMHEIKDFHHITFMYESIKLRIKSSIDDFIERVFSNILSKASSNVREKINNYKNSCMDRISTFFLNLVLRDLEPETVDPSSEFHDISLLSSDDESDDVVPEPSVLQSLKGRLVSPFSKIKKFLGSRVGRLEAQTMSDDATSALNDSDNDESSVEEVFSDVEEVFGPGGLLGGSRSTSVLRRLFSILRALFSGAWGSLSLSAKLLKYSDYIAEFLYSVSWIADGPIVHLVLFAINPSLHSVCLAVSRPGMLADSFDSLCFALDPLTCGYCAKVLTKPISMLRSYESSVVCRSLEFLLSSSSSKLSILCSWAKKAAFVKEKGVVCEVVPTYGMVEPTVKCSSFAEAFAHHERVTAELKALVEAPLKGNTGSAEIDEDDAEFGDNSPQCSTEVTERASLTELVSNSLTLDKNLTGESSRMPGGSNLSRDDRLCIFLHSLNSFSIHPQAPSFELTGASYRLHNSVREFYYLHEICIFEIYNKLQRYFDELKIKDFNRKTCSFASETDVFVVRWRSNEVQTSEGVVNIKHFNDFEFCFTNKGLVPFIPSRNGNGVLHTQTKFIAANAFLKSYPGHRNFFFHNLDTEVLLYEAPPGGGKTHTLIESCIALLRSGRGKEVLILSANKTSRDEILKKLVDATSSFGEDIDVPVLDKIVLTIDSYLMNHRGVRCKLLFIDECFMVHAGAALACVEFTGCSRTLLFGDSRQIHFIDRNEYEVSKYSDLDEFISSDRRLYGEVSYRCPWDVCAWLSTIYPKTIATANEASEGKSSMKIVEIESVDDVPVNDNRVYLTMLQSEKKDLAKSFNKRGSKAKVLTVHEAQGETYKHVSLVRTKFQEDTPFKSVNHITVALSRHTESLSYCVLSSRRSDSTAEAIRKSQALVDRFRVHPTSFGGSTLNLQVTGVEMDNSSCKATSAPIGVINDFLNDVVPGSGTIDFGDVSAELSTEPFECGADDVTIRDSAPVAKSTDHDEQRV